MRRTTKANKDPVQKGKREKEEILLADSKLGRLLKARVRIVI
jgi:hypothetical protein